MSLPQPAPALAMALSLVSSPAKDPAAQDIGPLAWVVGDVRRCLELAAAWAADGSGHEPPAADPSPEQALHQAAGALDMVGRPGAARVVSAMEVAARLMRAQTAPPAAGEVLQRSAFAVIEYLDAVLHGRPVQSVALFPQYAALLALAGDLRSHPASLWETPPGIDLRPLESADLHGLDADQVAEGSRAADVAGVDAPSSGGVTGPVLRARLDAAVLRLVKSADPDAARELALLSAGLAGHGAGADAAGSVRRLWRLATAFFESLALAPDRIDVPAKRTASRLLVAYSQQVAQQGAQPGASAPPDTDALSRELLYACAAAGPVSRDAAPRLAALRAACGLADVPALDHQSAPFGRYDPALLATVRKRLASAREGWAALAGGETRHLRSTVEQFGQVAEAVVRLHAPLAPLAEALAMVAEQTVAAPQGNAPAEPPPPTLAMEVATAILFLEALCQAFDPSDPALGERATRLAERLGRVRRGAAPEPLEPWIESLYRQASDRQTLGSVVDELRACLSGLEKDLDQFFRQRADRTPLQAAPGRLSQMRGVLSVLGLEQAARAVLRMRDQVQSLWAEPEGPQAQAFVEALGQNLGALGFLIDMLSYQPQLARQLFVFDEPRGELRPVMGRVVSASPDPVPVPPPTPLPGTPPPPPPPFPPPEPGPPPAPVIDPPPEPVTSPVPVIEPPVDSTAGAAADELLDVFMDEAREVITAGREALSALEQSPADLATLTVLRRCFHTLKGSARMVGLEEMGQAGWALEQLLNAWLAQARAAEPPLRVLAGRALDGLGRWVEDLARGEASGWRAAPFTESADALRLSGQPRHLALPGDAGVVAEELRSVGPLRIPAGLFNVFLQEADEDSLRLQEGLSAWAQSPALPPAAELETLAHSLAGSSATVGFASLSELARQLELALQRTRVRPLTQGAGQDGARQVDAEVLVAAGEHIRQLLHQFAAGFLREPDASFLAQLATLATAEAPGGLDFDLSADAAGTAGTDPAGSEGTVRFDPMVFALFEEEALELLPQLDAAARAWLEQPQNDDAQAAVLRLMHTVKGGARLAGLRALGELAHAIESQAEALPPPNDPGRAAAVAAITHAIDRLQSDFEALRLKVSGRGAPSPLLLPLPFFESFPEPFSEPASGFTATADGASGPLAWSGGAPGSALAPVVLPPGAPALDPLDGAPPDLTARAAGAGVVRVRAHLLDRLMNQTGEVMITGARLESEMRGLREGLQDLSASVERLRQQLREVEIQAETQMPSSQPGHSSPLSQLRPPTPGEAGFDPLEFDRFNRLQELTRLMAESVNDIATVQRQLARTVDVTEDDLSAHARQTRELQRDLLRTRMLEFGSLAERLHRTLRQASQDSGKSARLEIEGGAIEIDRGMLDRMTPVFEHLIRNAVAHGLETAEQRAAAGKPAAGLLRIGIEQVGNDVAVTFQDDGAGLDLARIEARARAQGLVPTVEGEDQDQREPLTPQAAADLIFRPGFSTASRVTELAGRGVGLDVVRAEVQALGGRIEIESQPGQGACFRLLLPLTTAVTHVLMVRCGALRFGVPASLVETVLRSDAPAVETAHRQGTWALEASEPLPFFWGGALLRVSRASQEATGRAVPVLLMQSAAQRLALQVDEVLGHREVVVKHLGPQLARLPGLAGMTVLASGEVILIYNPVALAAVYGDRAREFSGGGDPTPPVHPSDAAAAAEADGVRRAGPALDGSAAAHPAQAPLVLVVDDSVTVRRVTQRLLQREGYRVALAADGLQALERLAQERPVVVLSDIEMPRMDGFELARHLRGDPRWATLPLVFISSRTAAKHREHAQTLGVFDYLGKPYAEEELLGLVRRLVEAAAAEETVGDGGDGGSLTPQVTAAGFFTTA